MLNSSHLSIHARKLYLASLFRVFDELDAVSSDSNYEATRPRHLNTQTPESVLEGEIPSQCQFKNTLKNGIVVGALESRYDHFVRDEEESEG